MKKRRIKLFFVVLFVFSIFGILKPYVLEAKIKNNTSDIVEDIAEMTSQKTNVLENDTATTSTNITEISTEVSTEETKKFNIDWMKDFNNVTENEYLNAPSIGLIEIPDSKISVALRYGTRYKSNIESAAGITEFSTDERLYVLGHNYKNGTIFHDLLETKIGELVYITLVNKEKNIVKKYSLEVVFTKRYTEKEYENNNFEVLTDNPDYQNEYDLVLATCNHYSKNDKGRQVVLCRLVEE
jgi:sortase (surface protein transpeptidase)